MEQQKDNNQKMLTDNAKPFQGQNMQGGNQRQGGVPSGTANPVRPVAPSPAQQHGAGTSVTVRPAQEKQPVQRGFDYVLRKAEKLTTALYLVTDIMSEKEPLKWKTREVGVDLLSDITIAAPLSPSEKMSMLRNIMKKVEKTVAFLDVAQSAHLMSEMNSAMLKKEYLALKDSIESEWSRVYEASKSIFSETFFDVPRESVREPELLTSAREHTPEAAKEVTIRVPREEFRTTTPMIQSAAPSQVNQSGRTQEAREQTPKNISAPAYQEIKRPTTAEPIRPVAPMSTPPQMSSRTYEETRPAVSATAPTPAYRPPMNSQPVFARPKADGDRDDRRKIILALIKQKPSLTVRDIVKSIPQVSEKTIQRELLAMVSEGTLLKKGERRWSTYSLRVG